MPSYITVKDPPAGPHAKGRVRIDHRIPQSPVFAPPLVLIGGMTQTLSSWGAQLRPLSATREVLVYEARGQGQTELSLDEAGLAQQADDVAEIVRALDLRTPIDLSGFSFGGRVALAAASRHPQLIRKLVLTGVGAGRNVTSRLILRGWLAALETGNLHAIASISLADILGPDYLNAHAKMLDAMVQATVQRNTFNGISALFRHTLGRELMPDQTRTSSEYVAQMPLEAARHVHAPALLLGGALDRIAPPDEVATLAKALGAQHHTLAGVGHTAAIENPEDWRKQVLAFLDQD